jgi:transposase InsO family protein
MKYLFIKDHSSIFPVKKMAQVLKVSKSSYYHWCNRGVSSHRLKNDAFSKEVEDYFFTYEMKYGSPRIASELAANGIPCSENKVARFMSKLGLKAWVKPKFRVTTDSNHDHPVSPNLLGREFNAEKPNQKWVSDITYIYTQEGWLYLCVIIDLFSRKVVGWATSSRINTDLLLDAFLSAVILRCPPEGLIFHSDRGVQYASIRFRKYLKLYGMRQSMSKKGDCWDNACAESFFSSIKREEINRFNFKNKKEAHQIIFEYIELFYNLKRRHSYIGNVSPVEFEMFK